MMNMAKAGKHSKKMSDPAAVRAASPEPSTHRTGSPTVEFSGHFVNVRDIEHVTKPAKANAGSHDHLTREDGSTNKLEGGKSAKLPAWTKGEGGKSD
jgi:hypothetical protein